MIDYSKFGFLPYQVNWLNDTSQIKLYEKSRRIGITYAQAFEDVVDAGIYGKFNVWFSSNSDTNAREYIDYIKKFARTLGAVINELAEDNDMQTYVVYFKNGTKITALSSNPNQLHGKGGKMILDEFARRQDEHEAWEAASPAALVWGFPIRIISTHNGRKSKFYNFIKKLKANVLKWSHHKTTYIDAVNQGLADKAKSKKLTKKERLKHIEEIKTDIGDSNVWNQQFMCEPYDGDTIFMPAALLDNAVGAKLMPISELWECRELYAGLDVARRKNLSVLWLIEKLSNTLYITRHIKAMQNMSFPDQEKIINTYYAEVPNLRRIAIDQTGVGIGLADYLEEKHGLSKLDRVHFTNAIKEVMAFRLKRYMQDKSLLIPDELHIKEDFALIKQDTTAGGNIRLIADTGKDGNHADYFWGAALALEAASGGTNFVEPEVWTNRTRKNERTSKVSQILAGFSRNF